LSERETDVRKRYLDQAATDLDNRLRASIHFIDLDIRDDPEAIRPAWGYRDFNGEKSYDNVAEAFAAARRRLLILGQPGSGKSTALVHLAKRLLREAGQDADAPLPFIVNLSKFRLAAPYVAGLLVAAAFHMIPFGGRLAFLNSQCSQAVAAGAGVVVGMPPSWHDAIGCCPSRTVIFAHARIAHC
jgi:hypothetical protein